MKRRILPVVLVLAMLCGCGGGQGEEKTLTPEERTQLYQTAIESARDAEMNEAVGIITDSTDETAPMILELLDLEQEEMTAYAISVSLMNVKAYGIAAVFPAAGKEDDVRDGLADFIEIQKESFREYLPDQYDIARNARLETLEDGTILMVMSEDQDAVFDSIRDAIEAQKI